MITEEVILKDSICQVRKKKMMSSLLTYAEIYVSKLEEVDIEEVFNISNEAQLFIH